MAGFTVDPYNVNKPMSFVEEAGNYNVEITDARYTAHNGSGNEMITFNVKVIDGKYQGSSIRFNHMSWDEKDEESAKSTFKRFNSLAIALGAKKGVQITVEQLAQNMKGKKINVFTDWGKPDNKGHVYLNVYQYYPLDPDGSKPNGKKNPASDTGNKPKTKSNGSPATDPFASNGDSIDIDDDDLPF